MTERRPHYLRGNASVEVPQQFIVFDTETDAFTVSDKVIENRLRFGWACYQRRRDCRHWCQPEWFRFEKPMQFWQWVLLHVRSGTRLYLFCHNANFDIPVLKGFASMRKLGWKLYRAIIDSPPVIVKWRQGKCTVELLDTLNWWKMPLAKIGESVGVRKLDMPGLDASSSEWDTYCKQDCEVLRFTLLRWWQTLVDRDLGGFAPTIASQAMRWWRHKHMSHQVLVHCEPDALRLERAAYYGGRNEAWFIGKHVGEVYYLDFTSAYPAVMHDESFPVRLLGVDFGAARSALPLIPRGYGVIAEVLVKTDQPIAPRVIGKRLCFPTGTFWCVLTGIELAQILKCGEICEIGWSAAFEMQPIFRTFVDECWQFRHRAKLRKDESESYFFKILGNSLYGKFGQNGMKWDNDRWQPSLPDNVWIEYDHDTGKITTCRRLAGLMQSKARESESYESIPSIAAYVTAYQRVRLWEFACQCGLENVLYLDTDGLFVTADGYRRVKKDLDGTRLGTVKVEGTAGGMAVRGCKDYTFDGHDKIKGVRKAAEWIGESEVRQQQWSSLKGSLRQGTVDTQTIQQVTKRLSRVYTKGTLLKSGRVKPLALIEGLQDSLLPRPGGSRRSS